VENRERIDCYDITHLNRFADSCLAFGCYKESKEADGENIKMRKKREFMKKTTLLIMEAGIGSRYQTDKNKSVIKQLEPVGMNNEIIMDFSIHDAVEAGFNKIVFIIRHDIEADFRERIGNRIETGPYDKLAISYI